MGSVSLAFQHLNQPEYLHVLLNHWPVEGLAAGAFALAAGFLTKSLEGRRGALVWLVVVGVAGGLAIHYGEKGYDRVYAMSNGDAQAWLEVHVARAERFERLFAATVLSALGALISSWKRPRWEKTLSGIVLLLSIASFVSSVGVSHAGGQIRHSEFRDGPPR